MLSCPYCDGPVEKVTESRPELWSASMIVRCAGCTKSFHLAAVLVPIGNRDMCGTETGYQRHLRNGGEPCDDCKLALRVSKARYRKPARVA